MPGVELDGVVKAVDYLLNVNRGYRMDLGRRVVVIGGGFVAFDAARTALRAGREEERDRAATLAGDADARVKEALDSARAALRGGAAEVTIVSLESFDEMPVLRTTQGHEEFEEAQKRGRRASSPAAARSASSATAACEAIELRAVRSVFDAERPLRARLRRRRRRRRSRPTPASSPSASSRTSSFLKPADGVELTPGGTIRVDPRDARHLARRASSPAATSPSARAT